MFAPKSMGTVAPMRRGRPKSLDRRGQLRDGKMPLSAMQKLITL
jgi:hypothetical protein